MLGDSIHVKNIFIEKIFALNKRFKKFYERDER